MAAMSLSPAGDGLPADVGGGVGGAQEVRALDQQVGGVEPILSGAARTDDGAIVADPQDDAGARSCAGTDAVDQGKFAAQKRH